MASLLFKIVDWVLSRLEYLTSLLEQWGIKGWVIDWIVSGALAVSALLTGSAVPWAITCGLLALAALSVIRAARSFGALSPPGTAVSLAPQGRGDQPAEHRLQSSNDTNASAITPEHRKLLHDLEYFAKRYIEPPHDALKKEVFELRYALEGGGDTLYGLYDIANEYLMADLSVARSNFVLHITANGSGDVYELLAIYISKYMSARKHIERLINITGRKGTEKYKSFEAENKQLEDALRELRSRPEHRALQRYLDQYRFTFKVSD